MIKKTKNVLLIIVMLAIILVATTIIYVQVNKIEYATRVIDYLTEEINYSREEIASVKGVWGKKLPSFYAVVIFEDEPDVEYIYFAHNEVMQFGYRLTGEMNQKGILESDLKHFEK